MFHILIDDRCSFVTQELTDADEPTGPYRLHYIAGHCPDDCALYRCERCTNGLFCPQHSDDDKIACVLCGQCHWTTDCKEF